MKVVSISPERSVLLFDILTVIIVYFLPSISHLAKFSLQLLEPFRWFVLVNLVVFNQKHNALLLALTLPLFSFAIVNHPCFLKVVLISSELVLNVVFYVLINNRWKKPILVIFGSIILSKIVYYLMKYVCLHFNLIDSLFVSTSILVQIVVSLLIAVILGLFQIKKSRRNG